MSDTMDPLEGIPLDGASILKTRTGNSDLGIVAGDRLIVREQKAEPGQLILAKAGDGKASLRRFEEGQDVMVAGVVVGLVRSFG